MGGAPYKSAKEGWALFQLFPHLTMKERLRHVYSNSKAGSKPSKQIIGHKITYNGISDGEHSVARCSLH